MDNLDLHREIECLRTSLRDANALIASKEEEMVATEARFCSEIEKMSSEMDKLKERYERLLSNHQHLSKLNHELEAKLLQTIESTASEKNAMANELESTKARYLDCEAKLAIAIAERDRYKEDCAIAASLLQANPDRFLSQLSQKLPPETAYRPGADDHLHPGIGHFPTFLPTFPPIGLSSMMPLNHPTHTTSSAHVPNSNINRAKPHTNSSGYLMSKGSVISDL